jgi:hypothetical protein
LSPAEVVRSASAAGLTLRADGADLVVRPAGKLTPELRALLIALKPELLAYLAEAHGTASMLIDAAMRACDHWQDSPETREQMKSEVAEIPPHLRDDLFLHLRNTYGGTKQ